MIPVWLLDVDGVVNAFRAGWYTGPRLVQVYSAADDYLYRIRYEPRVLEMIRRVHEGGLAEVTWCSTWCGDATALEQGLGLPELPRAFASTAAGEAACQAKAAAARRVIASGRRLVWTDDVEIAHHAGECGTWTADGRALVVAPNESRGLRPRDLRRIEEFLVRPDLS
ncbi:hypothetical protein Ait01nite_039750 [Actinoplanes italicus]|uniref:Uncharacterized protein n=1 Tax=Actinoplanes italicus TaxID=113567 RepID=A0A2T0JWZ5_9ACTN|nr:hypothetical protein [Actinoplanes italicus]PRX12000.1 hypothetical protein CLV67_13024 [Actinoplanes italicus]GIE30930.1 hypothetical protein Ait01nite_039750 [Actinoplanes italicus]